MSARELAWVEIRSDLDPDDRQRPARIAQEAIAAGALVHVFFYEPWSPFVCRAYGARQALDHLTITLGRWAAPPEIVEWDPHEDRELFGAEFYDRAVARFFEAGTRVAFSMHSSDADRAFVLAKLVHCFLNANGLDWPDEIRFARRYARRMRRVIWRERLRHLRRRVGLSTA